MTPLPRVQFGGRPDASAKAAGRAGYTEDLAPADALVGVVVRAQSAPARVAELDVAAAAAVVGVRCVLTAADVPQVRMGIVEQDEPVLASDDIRYVGEPIALIAATDLEAAEAAAAALAPKLVDTGPRAVSLESAMVEGAPPVVTGEGNVKEPSVVERLDVDDAFSDAHAVVSTTVRTARVHQGYIERRAAFAAFTEDGQLVVTMCSQAPFQVRQTLSALFSMPLNRVTVKVPAFGGGFGGKLHNGMAPYAACLARATGRTVRVASTRSDELQASNPREASVVTLDTAVSESGDFLARRAVGHYDSGAYAVDTAFITSMGALQAGGPYQIPAVSARMHAVRTHLQPTGSFRAPSGPQMCFANEVHLEDIAAELGLSPVELRRRNLMRAGGFGPTGQSIESDAARAVLDVAEAVMASWQGSATLPAGAQTKVGIGVAMSWWFTAPGHSSATLRMEDDGSATLLSGSTEIGTGAVVSGVRAIVARRLGLAPEQVHVVSGNTETTPPDFGSEGSRTLYGAGTAAMRAADEVRAILAEEYARRLEASASDVDFTDGTLQIAGSPETAVSIGELVGAVSMASGPVVGTGRFQAEPVAFDSACATNMPLPTFNEPTFHCHVAEVHLDTELGRISIPRYLAVHDTGTVVDRPGVLGQIQGGVVQGIGQALFEEIMVGDDGSTLNDSLVDYRLPTICDIPDELVVNTVEDFPSRTGPLGAKGIGEAPVMLAPATLASAIRNAAGVRLTALPLSAGRVLAALREQRS